MSTHADKDRGRYIALRKRRRHDLRITGLSPEGMSLLFRLMLAPGTTIFGAIEGGPAALAEECGLEPKDFRARLKELEDAGLVVADFVHRLLFVPFIAEDNPIENRSVAIGRARVLGDLPDCKLRRVIAATMQEHAGEHAEVFREACSTLFAVEGPKRIPA